MFAPCHLGNGGQSWMKFSIRTWNSEAWSFSISRYPFGAAATVGNAALALYSKFAARPERVVGEALVPLDLPGGPLGRVDVARRGRKGAHGLPTRIGLLQTVRGNRLLREGVVW